MGGLIGIVIMLLVVFVVFGDGILESVGLGGTRTNSEGLVSDSGVLNILLVGTGRPGGCVWEPVGLYDAGVH